MMAASMPCLHARKNDTMAATVLHLSARRGKQHSDRR